MKKTYTKILSILVIVIVFALSVGYSAFGSEVSISNIVADIRVKSDIRITSVAVVGGTISDSIENFNYDTDSILLDDLLVNTGDSLNLEVTVMNIESTEMGIFEIVVPDGISYSVLYYNIGDKICDSTGKCNLGITKTFQLNLSVTDGSLVGDNVKIDFDFRKMHTISYAGVENNNYPTSVIDGGCLSFSFVDDIPETLVIYSDGEKVSSSKYSYVNHVLTFENVSGDLTIKNAKKLFNIIQLKTNGVDTNLNFGIAPSETNGNGVNTMSGTESNEYPIYYYRGNVTDNNVKFANFCWKIVRTTDTGGVKLIYNGAPASDGSCANRGITSQIGTSLFYSAYNSPAYVGYMYGTVYAVTSKTLSSQTDTYVYGNDVTWDGTNYTLTDTMTSSSWGTDYQTLATKYHYTCFNDTGICDQVHYINYFSSASTAYYLTLSSGKNIEDAKEEMFANVSDSKIKTTIDTWYASNMRNYEIMLEDTVWCNDRTLVNGALYSKDTYSTSTSFFGAYMRNFGTIKPSLSCTRVEDSFTVDSTNGNGKLNFPVGLLTADEYTLAGSGLKGYSTTSYLHTGTNQWSLSPGGLSTTSAGLYLNSSAKLNIAVISSQFGVRPSVSLRVGVLVSGDGSTTNPYIVE